MQGVVPAAAEGILYGTNTCFVLIPEHALPSIFHVALYHVRWGTVYCSYHQDNQWDQGRKVPGVWI